ncbi:EAL domain-containing protein [Sulfurimonas sp.]|nr:EAL domain-containing protein [Sulfurimonas sp.]
MDSLTKVKLIISTIAIILYIAVYSITTNDLAKRTQNILDQQVENLNNNYTIAQDQFRIVSNGVYDTIINEKEILGLLRQAKEFKESSKLGEIREKLQVKLRPHYDNLKKLGVITLMFTFEDNSVLLRVHKPDKYGDDLSNVRYSFSIINRDKVFISGFENGKSSHAFRNMYPIFYNDEYLGSVDISFSSDTIEKNMLKLHKEETHFIVHKSVFDSKVWISDHKTKYVKSVEHDDFLFSKGDYRKDYTFDDVELNFNKKFKKDIDSNIQTNKLFSLNDMDLIVSFLPIRNIQDKKVLAYLVSYKDSKYLRNTLREYKLVNVIAFIIIILIGVIVYINVKQRLFLQKEVNKKTEDLKYLNENLELEVKKHGEVFKTLFDKASHGISIIDGDEFVECNEAVINMLGYDSKDALLHKHPSDLSPEYQDDGRRSFEKANEMIYIAVENGVHTFEWIHLRASGEEFWAEITLTPIYLLDKDVIYVVWRDISKHKKAQSEIQEQKKILQYRANHDSLTGLPNRTLFNDRLTQSIKSSARHSKKFAVMFIDLDRFKQINDSLGHAVGDKVLKEVSRRLMSLIREEDTLARLGGDEFTVLMLDLDEPNNASILASKIIESVSKPIYIDKETLYVSASIGISLFPKDATSSDALLMYADNAMYKAKDNGRNSFEFYTSDMTALALSKVVMESSMRKAIENESFIVYYQPQINARTNQVTGMEALVRWNHKTMGIIPPSKFIPIAEDTGMIVELDEYVMRTAMKQVKSWYDEGLSPGVLSLNLSVKSLQQQEFVGIVKSNMIEQDFNAQWLELEVTESQIMLDPEHAIDKLKKISSLGIEIAVDDFGTGYSSLSYLKLLPIDKLKIDRSFIDEIPQDENDMAITKAIISLAKSLNLSLIAEGVETEAQKAFLLDNGCDNIQGYLYSKPLPLDDMHAYLMERN